MSTRCAFVYSLIVLVVLLLAGCSDSHDGRKAISGTVKLEGQPLKAGSIVFLPLEQENQSTQSGGPVTNGEFHIPRKDGLKPGKYLVRITSGDGKTPADEEAGNPGGSTNIVSFDRIPPDWGSNSKQQIDVKSNQTNRFDFVIPKAATPRRR